ncbi:unnamed protein product, partial [marine sediment metagenome]
KIFDFVADQSVVYQILENVVSDGPNRHLSRV